MKIKTIILVLSIALLAVAGTCAILHKCLRLLPLRHLSGARSYTGEKIIYDVRLGKVNLGSMSLNNRGMVKLENKELNLTTAETKLTQFKDVENIYSDPVTFLPVRVERDITKWMLRERITEEYNQDDFTVTITKLRGRHTDKIQIKSNAAIQNPMLIPHYLRRIPDPAVGKTIIVNLPSRRLEVRMAAIEDVEVPAGVFRSYHFISIPAHTEIWITADEQRIPVKIQEAGMLSYSMLMREYSH